MTPVLTGHFLHDKKWPNASCFLELFSVGGAGVTPARLLALSTSRALQIILFTRQAAYGQS